MSAEEKQLLLSKKKRGRATKDEDSTQSPLSLQDNAVSTTPGISQSKGKSETNTLKRQKKEETDKDAKIKSPIAKKDDKKILVGQKSIMGFFARVETKTTVPSATENNQLNQLTDYEKTFKPFFVRSNVIIASIPSRRDLPDDFDTILINQNMDVSMKAWVAEMGKPGFASKLDKRKLLKFHENIRPPYHAVFQKKSKLISGRRPFAQDNDILDYEVDSDEEWEDDESGEVLQSDDEIEEEDYEEDDFVVAGEEYSEDENQIIVEDADPSYVCHVTQRPLILVEPSYMKTEKIDPRLDGLSIVFLDVSSWGISPFDEGSDGLVLVEKNSTSTPKSSRKMMFPEKYIPVLCNLVDGSQLSIMKLKAAFLELIPERLPKTLVEETIKNIAAKQKGTWVIKDSFRSHCSNSSIKNWGSPESEDTFAKKNTSLEVTASFENPERTILCLENEVFDKILRDSHLSMPLIAQLRDLASNIAVNNGIKQRCLRVFGSYLHDLLQRLPNANISERNWILQRWKDFICNGRIKEMVSCVLDTEINWSDEEYCKLVKNCVRMLVVVTQSKDTGIASLNSDIHLWLLDVFVPKFQELTLVRDVELPATIGGYFRVLTDQLLY